MLNVANRRHDLNQGEHVLFDSLVIEIEDSWSASPRMSSVVIPKAMEFINKHYKHKRILVHCSAGKSRSGAVIVAWLMLT